MAGAPLWSDLARLAADGLLPLYGHGEALAYALLGFIFGLWLIYDGFRKWQQLRLVEDTPTEQVRSVAAGRTELSGTARELDGTLDRPFSVGECLLATYEIEEWRSDDDGGHWTTVDEGVLSVPFAIDDGTGSIRVEPPREGTYEISEANQTQLTVGGGETEPPAVAEFLRNHSSVDAGESSGLTGTLFDSKRRYTEHVIPASTDVYVLGSATPHDGHEREDAAAAVDGPEPLRAASVAAGDGDGTADVGSGGEVDRDGAEGDTDTPDGVAAAHEGAGGNEGGAGVRSNPERLVLGRDEGSEEFILSDRSEDQLVSHYRWRSPAQIVGGLALSSGALYFILFVTGA